MASPSGPRFSLLADEQFALEALGNKSASPSTGGLLNLDNSGSTGAGLVVYSTRGADAAGRLVHIWQNNAANIQSALRVQNEGTGIASAVIQNNTAGNEAFDVLSLSETTTAFGVKGSVKTQSLAKFTHVHPSTAAANDDAGAAILRLNWQDDAGNGTAVQGIFMATENPGPATIGDLVKLWNGPSVGGPTTAKFRIDASGNIWLASGGVLSGGPLVGDSLTVRPTDVASGTGAVVVDYSGGVGTPGTANTFDILSPTASITAAKFHIRIGPGQTWTFGTSSGFRALNVQATINLTGNPAVLFGVVFGNDVIVNLDAVAARKFNSIRTFRNSYTINPAAATNYTQLGSTVASQIAVSFFDNPVFTAFTGGNTGLYSGLVSFRAAPVIDTGWTFTTYSGYDYVPTGAGTITNATGFDVNPANTLTFTNAPVSYRSRLAAFQMQHAGAAVFGADAGPTSAGVALEVQSTTQAFLAPRMTGAQMNAIAGAVDGMIVYVNDNATVPGPNFYSHKGGAWVAGV